MSVKGAENQADAARPMAACAVGMALARFWQVPHHEASSRLGFERDVSELASNHPARETRMSGQFQDVNRRSAHADPQRAGSANPSASPPFVSELAASIAAAADAGRSGPRIRDPALRSALLRARLLRDWKAI